MDDQSSHPPPPDRDAKSALPAGAVDLALTDAAQCASQLSAELGAAPDEPDAKSQPKDAAPIEKRTGKVDAQLDAIDEMLSNIVQDVGEEAGDGTANECDDSSATPADGADGPIDAAGATNAEGIAPAPKSPAAGKTATVPPSKAIGLPAKKAPAVEEPEKPLTEPVIPKAPAAKPLPPVTLNKPPKTDPTESGDVADAMSDAPQKVAAASEISREEWEQFDESAMPSLDDGSGEPELSVVTPPDATRSPQDEPPSALSDSTKRSSLVIRHALAGIADALDAIDRPFVRLGDRVRSVLGWAAIMTLFAAACIILTLQFV